MRRNRQVLRSHVTPVWIRYHASYKMMFRDVAGAVQMHEARTKKRWMGLLSRNAVMCSIGNPADIALLQATTLAEFDSLLRAASFRRWVLMHEPHARALHYIGFCGFISVLSYFATGEVAVFEGISRNRNLARPEVAEARSRWRFFAQREMDAQCIGCHRICAIIKYPERPWAEWGCGAPDWSLCDSDHPGSTQRPPA